MYICKYVYTYVFCFIFGCLNRLLSLEFATSINIHWFNHCTPMFLNETFTANCNGLPFWGYILIYYQCWAGTVEQWLFFARCPPLKRLALTSPTISSSRSPWSLISSATQPHWRTAANLQWSSKNIRPWRTNTGVFRPRWPGWVQFWRGLMENGGVYKCVTAEKSHGTAMLFPLWILFWLISEADCFLLDSDGFLWISLKWHCLERKMSSEKKGTIFWCPKIFTVPKKAWCEPERPVRRWRFSSFSLRSPLIGSILCPMKPRHSTKMGWKKGGRKLDFPVGCLFFCAKKNKLSRRSRRNEMEKWFLKFGAEAYKVDLRQESCSDSCCQTHWIPHRHFWRFSYRKCKWTCRPPPLMFCFVSFPHSIWLDACHCQWKNTCQVALLDRKFDSRQVFGNPWPFPFPHLSTFQPQGDPAQSTAISHEQANLYASLTEYSLRVNEEKIRQCMRWDAERV